MTNSEKALELQNRQNAVILNIAGDIRSLKEKLEAGGLTKAEEDKVFADWEESIVKLETLAAATPEEETPTEG